MDKRIKVNIDFEMNIQSLLKLLNANETSPIRKRTLKVASLVRNKVKPKYILKEFKLSEVASDFIEINSQRFNSRVIPKQLKHTEKVFLFIATAGMEIAQYLNSVTDMLDKYILDKVAYMGYLSAIEDMQDYLLNFYNIKKYTSLCPGSIPDWDVREVNKIFELIGSEYRNIGVSVLKSGMINPVQSTSGILFEANDIFHSCNICQMVNCPNRKVEFNKEKQIEMFKL